MEKADPIDWLPEEDKGTPSVHYFALRGLLDRTGQISPHLQDISRLQMFSNRETGIEALLSEDIKDFYVIPEDYFSSGRVEWLTRSQGLISSNLNNEQVRSWLQGALLADEVTPEEIIYSRPQDTLSKDIRYALVVELPLASLDLQVSHQGSE